MSMPTRTQIDKQLKASDAALRAATSMSDQGRAVEDVSDLKAILNHLDAIDAIDKELRKAQDRRASHCCNIGTLSAMVAQRARPIKG
jgi:hypothetical protein